jgi:hypothetical protein
VFDGARRLARDIGADTDRHVAESLIHLEHLCSKAVAGLIDGRLYAFGVGDRVRAPRQGAPHPRQRVGPRRHGSSRTKGG